MTGSYTLYGRLGSGSSACEAMLALTGLPHEIVDFERWEKGAPPAELLAANPLGQVPALILPNGRVMTESAAITLFLADLAPQAHLAPAPTDMGRARYLRWMVYLAANSYMTALRFYYPERYTTSVEGIESVRQSAIKRDAAEWEVLAGAIEEGPFILGGTICAADIYAAMLLSWQLDIAETFRAFPGLRRLYAAVVANSVIASVWKKHDMPLSV
jgi:glutathione S-transferase